MTQGMARLRTLLERLQAQASAPSTAGELEVEDRRQAREARRQAIARLPLPLGDKMLRALERDELDATTALIAARRFMAPTARDKHADPQAKPSEPRPFLLLHGATGTGKSVGAAAAAIARPGSLWVYPRDLAEAYMSRYAEALARRHALEQAPLLVIDGLGAESAPVAHMLDALLGLLPVRLRRRTIITTQLSQTAYAARYKHAPLQHLLEQSAYHVSLSRALVPPAEGAL